MLRPISKRDTAGCTIEWRRLRLDRTTDIYERARAFEGTWLWTCPLPCLTSLVKRFNRQRNGLDGLGKLHWTRRSELLYELIIINPQTEGFNNVTARASTDVLSGRSFLAAHLDLGSWPSKKLCARRSRHSQVGCTIRGFTSQSMLSLS